MYITEQSEGILRRILFNTGFSENRMDLALAHRAFQEFSKIPFACADDIFLWESGSYRFSGEEWFHCSLTRQFTLEQDGEYSHMEQLRLALYYPDSQELRGMERELWSSDCGEDAAQFFREAAQDPCFIKLCTGIPPRRYELIFEGI